MSHQSTPLSQQLEMRITITDKGQTQEVSDVNPWVAEKKELLKKAEQLLDGYDDKPASLRKHYHILQAIVMRLSEIKAIFDQYNAKRLEYADANLGVMIAHLKKELKGDASHG